MKFKWISSVDIQWVRIILVLACFISGWWLVARGCRAISPATVNVALGAFLVSVGHSYMADMKAATNERKRKAELWKRYIDGISAKVLNPVDPYGTMHGEHKTIKLADELSEFIRQPQSLGEPFQARGSDDGHPR